MRRGFRRLIRRPGRWFLKEPSGRLTMGVIVWLVLLTGFFIVADTGLWVAFAFGAAFPVSLWMAYKGDWLPDSTRLDYLLQLTARQFEEAVADLLHPLGYQDIRLVGGAADLGVDVLCRDQQGAVVAIQCKRYQPDRDISSSAVQTFMGGMVAHKADKGIIVTTSAFSAPARDLATQQDIRLIDGVELGRLIHEHNLPVESK
jgi:hypothetical protein